MIIYEDFREIFNLLIEDKEFMRNFCKRIEININDGVSKFRKANGITFDGKLFVLFSAMFNIKTDDYEYIKFYSSLDNGSYNEGLVCQLRRDVLTIGLGQESDDYNILSVFQPFIRENKINEILQD